MPTERRVPSREDLRAVVEVRQELGPAYEDDLVDSLAEKIEEAIRGRVIDTRLREAASDHDESRGRTILGIASLAAGWPVSAICLDQGGLAGLAIGWLGIVGVNAAHALAWRRR